MPAVASHPRPRAGQLPSPKCIRTVWYSWAAEDHHPCVCTCGISGYCRRAAVAMLQARASASSQGHSLTCLELLQVSFPAAHDFLSTLRDRHRDPQSNVFLHDLMDPQETEPDRSKHVKIGKFARRVSKKYQAYMRRKRRIEGRAWFCNCGAPECHFCALTQRFLFGDLHGGGTLQAIQSPATPPPDERERSLALPRVLQRAANLAGRELEQPGGVQHERLGVYVEAETEDQSALAVETDPDNRCGSVPRLTAVGGREY